MLHISLTAERIGTIAGLPVTNSLLASWVVMTILFIFAYMATHNMTMVPRGAQLIAEMVVGGLYEFFSTVVGARIKQFFPLIASFFLFILIANWFGLLPGVGTIGFFHGEEFVPLLRASTAD